MLWLFIHGDYDFVRDHLTEHLLERAIAVQGSKIQTDGLYSLYAQGSEKPLSQAAPGAERHATEYEYSRERADQSRAPAPGLERCDKGQMFFLRIVPRF